MVMVMTGLKWVMGDVERCWGMASDVEGWWEMMRDYKRCWRIIMRDIGGYRGMMLWFDGGDDGDERCWGMMVMRILAFFSSLFLAFWSRFLRKRKRERERERECVCLFICLVYLSVLSCFFVCLSVYLSWHDTTYAAVSPPISTQE